MADLVLPSSVVTAMASYKIMDKITRLALEIKQASETVHQNKEECHDIARRVVRVNALLRTLQETEMVNDQAIVAMLEDLADTLEFALAFVMQCQRRRIVSCFLCAGDLKKQLIVVQDDLTQKLMIGIFAVNVQTTMLLTNIQPPPARPRPSEQQDAGVVDPSHSHHSTDDDRSEMDGEENIVPAAGSSTPVAPLSGFNRFSMSDLKAATDCFSQENIIIPKPSSVYKGVLCGREVAIKCHLRIVEFSEKRAVEGLKYVSTKLQHQNILRVLGYAYNEPEREVQSVGGNAQLDKEKHYYGFFVVEEKMPKGNLEQFIKGSQRYDWNFSVPIIKGIADGLRHLHDNRAVHSNLKPSNILFDSDHKPKICDFGVARVLNHSDLPESRYLPKECFGEKDTMTTMSDVYAFGVILLETIRGMCEPVPDKLKDTIEWAWKVYWQLKRNFFGKRSRRIDDLFKSSGHDKSKLKEIKRCMKIGLRCTEDKPDDRPNMADVVEMLDNISSANPKMLKSFTLKKR